MSKYLFLDDMLINVILKDQKPSGGAAVQTYAWIRGLMSQGHDVSTLTKLEPNLVLKKECADLKLLPLYENNKGIRWLRWIYYRIPFLYKSIKQSRPDYFIQGVPDWSTFILAMICKLLRIKFIVRVSNDNYVDNRISQFYGRWHINMLNMGLTMSYSIICQNDYQYKTLKKRYADKKIAKFGNPFHNNSNPIINEYKDRDSIAWVGLFQYQKNLGLLYEIAKLLKEETFKVFGSENFNGIDHDTKLNLQKLQSLKNVQFLGFLGRDDLLKHLQETKFLLNTSHYEGFSNTFLEAMYCGTPIITTENANPDSIINELHLGIVYTVPKNIESFVNDITNIEYKIVSNNCINYIQDFHSPNELAKRLENFLKTQEF